VISRWVTNYISLVYSMCYEVYFASLVAVTPAHEATWLKAAAEEVNSVWNWANEVSTRAAA